MAGVKRWQVRQEGPRRWEGGKDLVHTHSDLWPVFELDWKDWSWLISLDGDSEPISQGRLSENKCFLDPPVLLLPGFLEGLTGLGSRGHTLRPWLFLIGADLHSPPPWSDLAVCLLLNQSEPRWIRPCIVFQWTLNLVGQIFIRKKERLI